MYSIKSYVKLFILLPVVLVVFSSVNTIHAQLRIAEVESLGETINCYVGTYTYSVTLPQGKKLAFMPVTEGELQKILDQIAAHTDLDVLIEVVAVDDSGNAEACASDNRKNYVLYRPKWMEGLYNETQNKWAVYAVLAHEIGHFALGHDKLIYTKELEEQADEYAGRVLGLMNVDLDDTLSAFRSKQMHGVTGGKYPAIETRIAAATRGWESVKSSSKKSKRSNDSNNTIKVEKLADADAYYAKGTDFSSEKKYPEAVAYLTKAISLRPKFADAYYARAGAKKYGFRDYQGAIDDYTEAIDIKPEGYYYYARGLAKDALGDKTGAHDDFRQACNKKYEPGCQVIGEKVKNTSSSLNYGTLYSRQKYDDYPRACFSFEFGGNGEGIQDKVRNDWDLQFGNGGNVFDVTMVVDDQSRIADLGKLSWDDDFEIPVLPAHPEPTREPDVKAIVGHIYLVHTKDRNTDIYTLFRVESLKKDDTVTISWKRIDSPE